MVMSPVHGRPWPGGSVDAFVRRHIEQMRFTGIHRPLQGQYPEVPDHRLLQLADELGFWVHFWMYGDRQAGTAPPDALGFHHEHQVSVMEALSPWRNWSMGLGYDVGEWAGDNETTRWVRRLSDAFPGTLLAVRVRLDEERRDPTDPEFQRKVLGYRAGQIASFEQQILDKGELPDRLQALLVLARAPVLPLEPAVERPTINAERFRVRGSVRAKDWTLDQVAEGIKACREANVAAIWGYGPEVSDTGSLFWPEESHRDIREANGAAPRPPEPPPGEPASLLDTVKQERARYGTPLTNDEMGELLNEVAWRHRDDGWGLAAKSVGAYTAQPRTRVGISRDLLIHRPSGRMYDVLADVEGAAFPAWQDQGLADLPWVPPVAPLGGPEPPQDEPEPPTPPDDPAPEPEPPAEPELPDFDEQVVRAWRLADALALDYIESRLNDEVIRPFQALGFLGKIFQGPELLRHAENIIEDDYRPLIQDMKGEQQ